MILEMARLRRAMRFLNPQRNVRPTRALLWVLISVVRENRR